MSITIYTDGSSRGNPGRGGYGVILMSGTHRKELSGGFRMTTNNRMELLAVIMGLEALKKTWNGCAHFFRQQIHCGCGRKRLAAQMDCHTLCWWQKNQDLWMRYDRVARKHHVRFKWVKGHADNPYNNRCDELATAAADGTDLAEDTGYVAEVR
ncbi:MAG: ribonuclease HI [Chitinophagaceae bacterium]|nr:ribonuclease HI [Chitinophagaceae bacterium]